MVQAATQAVPTTVLKDLKGLVDHPDPKYRLYCISPAPTEARTNRSTQCRNTKVTKERKVGKTFLIDSHIIQIRVRYLVPK